MDNPDRLDASDHKIFIDRVDEATVLRNALRQHRERMNSNRVSSTVLRNVLTFYGHGGVGKTDLSRHLADWIDPEGETTSGWGEAPETAVSAIVRWDVNDSHGGLDPLPLLIELRRQLGRLESTWPAFDLAFGSFHRSLRPGVELRLRTPRAGSTTLSDVLAGLVGDVIAGADVAISGGLGAATFGAGQFVLKTAHARSRARKTLNDYPELAELVKDCESLSGSVEEIALVAGRIAFMLSEQIDRMEPEKRPLIVIFVDHMDRLQIPGETHLGEGTLNRLVSRLPYFLFVITGRDSLRWHEPSSTDLAVLGAKAWPLLSTESPPLDEPRQHRIGNLSVVDAELFLRTSFARNDIAVEDILIAQLAETSDGWPLHLDTIVAVAIERSSPGRLLTAADLAGPLPKLVERLLRDLPAPVADAFRTACLLPYFDTNFVAAAGQLTHGAVEQLLKKEFIRTNPGSVYPHRIHDKLRALVREAGSAVVGGWSESDWRERANRALTEAASRFESAMNAADDLGAIDSLALGLNVATENGTFAPWLIDAIRRSPNIRDLSTRIAVRAPDAADQDLVATLQFLQLRARADAEDVTAAMGALIDRRSAIASTAGLWRAYDLRKAGRTEEALDQFEQLIADFDDRPSLYRYQLAVTLRLARRYQDATSHVENLTDSQLHLLRAVIRRNHGDFEGAAENLRERVERARSRRFQVELLGDWLIAQHREAGVNEADIQEVYDIAVRVGHDGARADSLGVLAETHLFDEDVFSACMAELAELSGRRHQPYRAQGQALALRAWAAQDDDTAREAHHLTLLVPFRTSTWTPVEILLEEIGHPVPMAVAQWLEPYEVVRARWLDLLGRIVDRARNQLSSDR
ncbi:MAG TPA: hypothetical protein VF612_03970 [Jatrophihabitans sp.]|jgi:tetratricopeptide (TPR) repeat protein|uniref:hypothetical protein n=1 Tax=Jatrophihabitans sp. TaxID=1932789 RepID=UPI002F15FEC7